MDTQGLYGSENSLAESDVIFSMSMLLSSIQIYNIKSQLDEQALKQLKVRTIDIYWLLAYCSQVSPKELLPLLLAGDCWLAGNTK